MSEIRLFYMKGACSLLPHILFHEAGLSFTTSAENNGSISDELLRLNPKGKVPLLIANGEVITENIAIMTYISNQVPEKNLLGAVGTMDPIRVYEWFSWLGSTVHAVGFGTFFRPQRFTVSDDADVHAGIKEQAKKALLASFKMVEDRLDGVHAVGDKFTAADVYLLVFWRWAQSTFGMDLKAEFPKYSALTETVAKRESVVKAMREEGL
ncbi:hypothetical protein VN97_g4656 [Penicillium thymicola]|uniref:Glutathione S-transferase n=1 Tax=Penicillium thymicola TaxID=293382 RepID=A0AAI9X9A8_PENTH|nr:hypothetical protein VN97_g4656 [Penicillium thymicola]